MRKVEGLEALAFVETVGVEGKKGKVSSSELPFLESFSPAHALTEHFFHSSLF